MLSDAGVWQVMGAAGTGRNGGAEGGGFALVTMPAESSSVRGGLERALKSPPLRSLCAGDMARVEVLLAEVLNNIIEHAYSGAPGEIRVLLRLEKARLCLVVEDDGRSMPEGKLPSGMLPEPESLPEGGFGWFLIRSLAREISYMRRGETNRLDIVIDCEQ